MSPYISPTVMLSSLERMAFYLKLDVGRGRVNGINSDTEKQRDARRSLIAWGLSISGSMQSFCQRDFLITEETIYFDVRPGDRVFFPRGVPIVSITSLKSDFTGQFTGSEFLVDSSLYHIGNTGNTIEFWAPIIFSGGTALQYKGLGGLALDAVNSIYSLSSVTGPSNIKAGYYAFGETSESIGKVISYDADLGILVLESISGAFVKEPLTFQPAIYSQDIPDTGATIASIDSQSLVESCPNLSRAMEVELRYMQKHEFDFEHEQEGKYGVTRRKLTEATEPYNLQPETQMLMQPFRRYLMGK